MSGELQSTGRILIYQNEKGDTKIDVVKREVAEKLALEQYELYDAHRRALEAADGLDELTAKERNYKDDV